MKLSKYAWFVLPQTIVYIAVFVACMKWLPSEYKLPRIDFILESILTCAATFSGFTLTAISILLSFSRSTVITYLNKNDGVKELRIRYTWSLLLGMALILVCLGIGGMIGTDNTLSKLQMVTGILVSLAYFYNLISSGRYLLKTIALATSPPPQVSTEITKPKGKYRIKG